MTLHASCHCRNRFRYGNLLDLDLRDAEVGKSYILSKLVTSIDYHGKGFINYDEGKCVFLPEATNTTYANSSPSSLPPTVELVSPEHFYLKGVVL